LVFASVTLATAGIAASVLWTVLKVDGTTPFEALLLGVYALLIVWIAANFWLGLLGALRLVHRGRADCEPVKPFAHLGCRTVVAIPVCGESPRDVFARIRAMYRSLEQCGGLHGFEFFVLSDTPDPDTRLAEELQWLASCRQLDAVNRLFYRRRCKNSERKSGNLRDFLTRWGRRYDYMVVLDADSVMDGTALIEMVRRMEREPGLGLLQAWPRPAGGVTLFARLQQFAASVYGRLVASGMAWLLSYDGNYWGHNAIIRTEAFMDCCGLPKLPGQEPLGGEILSHDFVEAALLRRGGWKVRLADDIPGSYEQGPPDLIEHARRDRRWCQGNLQHIRVIAAEGLKATSRINLLVGIMAYAVAPLWLLFLTTGALAAMLDGGVPQPALIELSGPMSSPIHGEPAMASLSLATLGLLLGPKLIAFLTILLSRSKRRAHGGAMSLALGIALETIFSTVIAPVMLLLHSRFVAIILAGRSVRWNPQRRNAADIYLSEAWRAHRGTLVIGGLFAVVLAFAAPQALIWTLPIAVGLLAAVPITVLTSRARLGAFCRRMKLLLIPEEVAPPAILRMVAEEYRKRPALGLEERSGRPLVDSPFNAAHGALLGKAGPAARQEVWNLMITQAGAMSDEERTRVQSGPNGLRRLHANTPVHQTDLRGPEASPPAIAIEPDGEPLPWSRSLAALWRLDG
jgi:membrane glycosyltransferase